MMRASDPSVGVSVRLMGGERAVTWPRTAAVIPILREQRRPKLHYQAIPSLQI